MTEIGKDPLSIFIGYGLRSSRAMGTLAGVPLEKLTEFIVAEGLMVSAAIGLALAGLKPLVYFERMDFLANACDSLINHLDKLADLSRGEFTPGVIIRCTVGNKSKPLFTGPTHTQDLSAGFRAMLKMPVHELHEAAAIAGVYRMARDRQDKGESSMVVEYKDLIA